MVERVREYNVVWDTPSKDASGSMPVGNGDLGANVWVDGERGEVHLLLGKTDAWDENCTFMKLGLLHLRVTGADGKPALLGGGFRQGLDLATATIEIEGDGARVRVWADANHPVMRVEVEGNVSVEARVEVWRVEPRTVKTQTGDLFKNLVGKNSDPHPTVVWPDRVLRAGGERQVVWCHHNERREHDGFEINMRLQGLGGMLGRMRHPLIGRTFGCVVEGDETFERRDEVTLVSGGGGKVHRLSIVALTEHPSSVEGWQRAIEGKAAEVRGVDHAAARREHEAWWKAFWGRSWIYVRGDEDAFRVTRGYVLQRFMNACGGRGAQPIKFNGSIFSVGRDGDWDFRRWGGPGFWFMNQRLVYWPMLAMGDYDLMEPWLRMYLEMLPLQKERTRVFFKHGGAHYPETLMFWGAEVSAHYGWTPFEQRQRPEAECSYITYYWQGGIELTLILLMRYLHTGDGEWARKYLVPIADAVMEFYGLHYGRDEKGKLKIEPGQSLETWHEATNPLPEIAGLRYVLPKLIALPGELVGEDQRGRWKKLLGEVPEIPMGEKEGKRVVLPAERFDKKKNVENPELYCVFPYRLFGVRKPGLEVARETFAARLHPAHDCWSQDDIQMALLGLTEQAKEWIGARASEQAHSDSRFPGFWNAFHDWLPDMDHGGVLQLALQLMLMQCEGEEIRLLPAWPAGWEAEFKLHAPGRTVVEGRVRGGKVEGLRVEPEARGTDVVGK